MKIFLATFLFVLILFTVESKYEIILDRSELPMGDDDQVFGTKTFRIRKFNRTTAVMSGTYELKMEVDNSLIVSFEAFNLSGGQYKKLFGRTLGGSCEVAFIPHGEKDVRKFYEHTNISTPYGHCPVPAQIIYVDNWVPDAMGDYLPPYIPGNERWLLTVWLSKNDIKVGGISFYAILRDNQKLFDSKWKK